MMKRSHSIYVYLHRAVFTYPLMVASRIFIWPSTLVQPTRSPRLWAFRKSCCNGQFSLHPAINDRVPDRVHQRVNSNHAYETEKGENLPVNIHSESARKV